MSATIERLSYAKKDRYGVLLFAELIAYVLCNSTKFSSGLV